MSSMQEQWSRALIELDKLKKQIEELKLCTHAAPHDIGECGGRALLWCSRCGAIGNWRGPQKNPSLEWTKPEVFR